MRGGARGEGRGGGTWAWVSGGMRVGRQRVAAWGDGGAAVGAHVYLSVLRSSLLAWTLYNARSRLVEGGDERTEAA